MSRAFKVICISKAMHTLFLEKRRSDFFMFRLSKITEVIYDGVDTKLFSPKDTAAKIRRELNIDTGDFVVGIIGAVDRIKGQDILIKAAHIIIQKHPQAKFVIVGGLYADVRGKNKYLSNLVQLIKDLNLGENIIMTGFRHDINIFMNEIDILVQPSEREGLGTSMIEAMACAKPVIGTLIDGVPEVIGNNESGILLNPRTPEELAKSIIFFIENRAEAKKKGLKGRERALKMFNAYENIKRIQEIYNEALNYR